MKEIVKELLSLNPCMRVVINVIALETLASVISMLESSPWMRRSYPYRFPEPERREAIT